MTHDKLGRPSNLGKATTLQVRVPFRLDVEVEIAVAIINKRSAEKIDKPEALRQALSYGVRAILLQKLGVEPATLDWYSAIPEVQNAVMTGKLDKLYEALSVPSETVPELPPEQPALGQANHWNVVDFRFYCIRAVKRGASETVPIAAVYDKYKWYCDGCNMDVYSCDEMLTRLDKLCKSVHGRGIEQDEFGVLHGVRFREEGEE